MHFIIIFIIQNIGNVNTYLDNIWPEIKAIEVYGELVLKMISFILFQSNAFSPNYFAVCCCNWPVTNGEGLYIKISPPVSLIYVGIYGEDIDQIRVTHFVMFFNFKDGKLWRTLTLWQKKNHNNGTFSEYVLITSFASSSPVNFFLLYFILSFN